MFAQTKNIYIAWYTDTVYTIINTVSLYASEKSMTMANTGFSCYYYDNKKQTGTDFLTAILRSSAAAVADSSESAISK